MVFKDRRLFKKQTALLSVFVVLNIPINTADSIVCCIYFITKVIFDSQRLEIFHPLQINLYMHVRARGAASIMGCRFHSESSSTFSCLFPGCQISLFLRRTTTPITLVGRLLQPQWQQQQFGYLCTAAVRLRGCKGPLLAEEWQCWEHHMPLSTPARCVGGGLASPRIGPDLRQTGRQADRPGRHSANKQTNQPKRHQGANVCLLNQFQKCEKKDKNGFFRRQSQFSAEDLLYV